MNHCGGEVVSRVQGRVLVAGNAAGRLLRLTAPISLWGGVDAETGRVCDPRHPDHNAYVCDRILAIPAVIGSSSTSSIMLELLRNETAPAGVVLGQDDAILALGVIVAREMGYPSIPVIRIQPDELAELRPDSSVRITNSGQLLISDLSI